MKIENIKLSDLKPASYNPRIDLKPNDTEYVKIDKSIEHFGLVDPIIIKYPELDIIQGHQRIKPLIAKGKNDFKMLRLGDIAWVFDETDIKLKDESEVKSLNVALNKISGDWDYEKLNIIFEELKGIDDFDIELTGFDYDDVIVPDFEPGTLDDQGQLDNIKEKPFSCPECNHIILLCPECGYETQPEN